MTTTNIKTTVEARAILEARKDRSAWNKGVTAYALELLDGLEEAIEDNGRQPETVAECREWLLNGADDWGAYSWGGLSLIYDGDIAERLCTPSELKITRNEEWLDTQARALTQAATRLVRVLFHA